VPWSRWRSAERERRDSFDDCALLCVATRIDTPSPSASFRNVPGPYHLPVAAGTLTICPGTATKRCSPHLSTTPGVLCDGAGERELETIREELTLSEMLLSGTATDEDRRKVYQIVHPSTSGHYLS
jgi:hypothetical protein